MKKCVCCAAALLIILASLSGCGSSGDQYPPSVPSGVQAANVSSDSVQLNWTESQDDLLMLGYRVYRDGSRVGNTPLTSYTDTGLTPGTSYGYRVSAFDWIGNESPKSTTLFVATADGSAPSAPANLQGSAVSTSRIDLAWTASTDNVGVIGYRIYRNAAVIGTTTGTSFSDTGLSEYTTYTYRVAAYDAEGNESSQSSPLSATTVDATPPSVPSNLQGAASSTSRIDLTWSASTDNAGVTGYRVYRNGSLVASPAGTSYSDTGLAEATSYSYTVAAYDDEGNTSAPCGAVAVYTADATAPSIPSNLQGTAASTSQINLTWTASTDNVGVTGYKVYRNGSQIGMTASTSFSDTGLSEATSYSYRVAAYDAGNNESAQCGAAAVSTADVTAPSVPANLQGTGASASQINLTWTASTDNVGVTGYKVYRNGSQVGTASGTSYPDTGLSEATSYSYCVAAYDADGNVSSQCGAVSASTTDGTAPSIPAGLQATVVSSTQVDLSWTGSTDNVGVTGYRVYRNGSQVGTASGTSFSDTGLTAGTTYSYRVAAYDAAGNVSSQCAAVSATTTAASGSWSGTKLFGTSQADSAEQVAVDGSGNVYVAGYVTGSIDGQGYAGGKDMFLIKYDSSGNKLWTRMFGTATDDRANGVAVDSGGNVYVVGTTSGNLDGETINGGSDIALINYNSSGTKQWTRLLGTTADEAGNGVAVDGSGNIVIVGSTSGNLDSYSNQGSYDIVVAKYDAAGNKLWSWADGTALDDSAYDVALDGSGNVYVTGSVRGDLHGQTSSGFYDAFLMKFNSSGTRQWTRLIGTDQQESAQAVVVSGSYVYITGYSYGDFDGHTLAGSGNPDGFIVKYDTSGTKQWSVLFGAPEADVTSGVGADASGNVYVTGNTRGNLDGETNAGNQDIFLAKYNSSGSRIWTKLLGTTTNEFGRKLAVDTGGNAFMCGNSLGSLDGQTNVGLSDAYVTKYDTDGNKQ
jgi:chitodextrinase